MALVSMVLVTLNVGLVQFGLIYNTASTLTNIARDGARYAAIHATDTTTILNGTTYSNPDDAIRDYIDLDARGTSVLVADIPDANITITPANGASTRIAGNPITVVIRYDMRKKFFLPLAVSPGCPILGPVTPRRSR